MENEGAMLDVIASVSHPIGKRILTDYERHRRWLMSELCYCRAQIRNGSAPRGARKALQRELVKLRRVRPLISAREAA
jgi:hypothetical protein